MNKKDRIAIALTAPTLVTGVLSALNNGGEVTLVFFLGPLAYWGWRFVKADIGFLKMKSRDR